MNRLYVCLFSLSLIFSGASCRMTPRPEVPTPEHPGKKRIVLFFDGTSNTREDKTNVERLYKQVAKIPVAPDGTPQQSIYIQGVGTHFTDWFTGSAFGRGVGHNVREAYELLAKTYRPGDEIFLFGFSRGAFTARSLAGFVAQYGLLRQNSILTPHELYANYKNIDQSRPIYYLPKVSPEKLTALEKRLLTDASVVKIRFIGVWDTVGALGVPGGSIQGVSSSTLQFHELDPRIIFDECYQALAADELRPHFRPSLWTKFYKEQDLIQGAPPLELARMKYEQRWFVGAHSNVGGGYKNPSLLYQVPLQWMEEKASAAGLALKKEVRLDGSEHCGQINDSFAEFWPYKLLFWVQRTPRVILREPIAKVTKSGLKGMSFSVHETVDPTVYDRLKHDPEYRKAHPNLR